MRIGLATVAGVVVALAAGGALAQDASAPPRDAPSRDATARCKALAGLPDAGAPVNSAALHAYLSALSRARPDCEAAASQDAPDPQVLYDLGVIRQRQGRHKDAAKLFGRAAAGGVAAAHTRLGDYYNFGTGGIRQDVRRAIREYQLAEAQGDLPGMTTLALMYRFGRGVPQDNARALALLGRAAGQGYHFAQLMLARLAIDPQGIAPADARALGLPDPQMAVRNYARAGRQGNMDAALELARLYADDGHGVPADPVLRAHWTLNAAQTGSPKAMRAMGVLYERGLGVARDPERAADFYVRALESGKIAPAALRDVPGARRTRWDRQTAIAFQKRLIERGLYRGPLDGVVGPGTMAAARALAKDG